jgi:hypothetical protein
MRTAARGIIAVSSLVLAGLTGYFLGLMRTDGPMLRVGDDARDSAELRRLHDEDQADRQSDSIDWAVVGPRDTARRTRVKALFAENGLRTAHDFYHAAMILQHGDSPEDKLLAHEFCVVAIVKGKNDKETRWLAASAEDRFLSEIGRKQRFATQFRIDASGPAHLNPVDESVTDELRRLMDAPSLDEARAFADELNRKPVAPTYSSDDKGVVPPSLVEQPLPEWRPSAGRPRFHAVIDVIVNEHGSPQYITMHQSNDSAFEEPLMAASLKWRFKPATLNGQPVRYRTTVEVALPK